MGIFPRKRRINVSSACTTAIDFKSQELIESQIDFALQASQCGLARLRVRRGGTHASDVSWR